jgi:ligand-binding SRPBCC domain-containing protein
MNSFYYEFEVNSNIERVWEFYTDISHLEVITPSDIKLKIIQTSDQVLKKGAVACFSGKIIINAQWCSKITFFEKFGYIDEMISDENNRPPFQIWKHQHTFVEISQCRTRVIDKVEFKLPYGFVGRLFEFYIRFKLQKIFDHRKRATMKSLETSVHGN